MCWLWKVDFQSHHNMKGTKVLKDCYPSFIVSDLHLAQTNAVETYTWRGVYVCMYISYFIFNSRDTSPKNSDSYMFYFITRQ